MKQAYIDQYAELGRYTSSRENSLSPRRPKSYEGRCVCGAVRFKTVGNPKRAPKSRAPSPNNCIPPISATLANTSSQVRQS